MDRLDQSSTSAVTPNDLPPELIFSILSISLGQVDDRDWVAYRWKLKFLRSCCLISRAWLNVSQSFLLQNVIIRRSRKFAQFYRSIRNTKRLSQYVRSLSLAMPSWDDAIPFPITRWIEESLPELDGLEELQIKPPFDELINDHTFNRIQYSNLHLKKLTIIRSLSSSAKLLTRNHQSAIPPGTFTRSPPTSNTTNEESITPFDPLCDLALPTTIQHLHLTQPSHQFISQLPHIFSNFISSPTTNSSPCTTTVSSTNQPSDHPSQTLKGFEGLKSFSLRFIDANKDLNPSTFETLGSIFSSTMTSLSFCLSTRIDDETMIQLLRLTPQLEQLRLGKVGLSQFFRRLEPLKSLRSLSLLGCGPTIERNNTSTAWLRFCDAVSVFVAGSTNLERFEFDTDLSPHDVFVRLLIELIYLVTLNSNGTHSRLRHLNVKHIIPLPITFIERIGQMAPLLESLSIKVPVYNLPRLKDALSKITKLQRVELNNFLIVKNPNQKFINLDPFFVFASQQNRKRNVIEEDDFF